MAACAGPGRAPPGGGPPEGQSGRYKVGAPYAVDGVVYRPAVDYSYAETGMASWYGPKFHGQATANGETFDMNALTAAHRTLPLPSVVRVTNLENGRTLALRVNDRGPFARGRIIDVSRRAAQLLGFRYKGVTRVRVEILPEESRRVAAIARGEAPPPATQVAAAPDAVAPPPRTVPAAAHDVVEPMPKTVPAVAAIEESPLPEVAAAPPPPAATVQASAEPVYVQAGAFRDFDNAMRLWKKLSAIAPAEIVPATGDVPLYRVRLGPFADRAVAEGLRAAVTAADGRNAR